VFVEVKTRTSDYLGDPAEAVGVGKQKHIIRAADAYIKGYDGDAEIRFDIIAIVMNQKSNRVQHIEDAFYPTL
jgi:putative endonuclease